MIRSLAIATILLGSTSLGYAADLAALPLRGTIGDIPQAATWDGLYIAGHGGVADANLDLTRVATNQVNYLLRNTELLNATNIATWSTAKARDGRSATYGVLGGYNIQMDDTVVGIEADYTHAGLDASSVDSLSRILTLPSGATWNPVTVATQTSAKLMDYATVRGRVGYAFGNFLPFITGGAAVGRFQTASTTTITGNQSIPSAGVVNQAIVPLSASDGKRDNYKFGYVGGIGLEYMFGGGLFARAEYQYVAFGSFGKTDLHSARAAIGVKF